jgi:hypothetical protein
MWQPKKHPKSEWTKKTWIMQKANVSDKSEEAAKKKANVHANWNERTQKFGKWSWKSWRQNWKTWIGVTQLEQTSSVERKGRQAKEHES